LPAALQGVPLIPKIDAEQGLPPTAGASPRR
jgi:hypothetical protein